MFQKIRFINLATRHDRCEHMYHELQGKCNVGRFEAVTSETVAKNDGKLELKAGSSVLRLDVSDNVRNNIRCGMRKRHCEIDTWSQVACFYSHASLWHELAHSSKDQAWFILEDDVEIGSMNWENQLQKFSLPTEYDFIFLDVIRRERFEEVHRGVERMGLFWGTHAYIITAAGARKMCSLLEKLKTVDRQVDGFLYEHRDDVNVFHIAAGLFRQNEAVFGTDVQEIYHKHLEN